VPEWTFRDFRFCKAAHIRVGQDAEPEFQCRALGMNSASMARDRRSDAPARMGGAAAGSAEFSTSSAKSSFRNSFSECVQGTRSFTSASTAGRTDRGEQIVHCKPMLYSPRAFGGLTWMSTTSRESCVRGSAGEARVRVRMDVEHPGIGERAVMARAAIGGQPQMIGMFGPNDARVVDAKEHAGTGECRALRNQGGRERLRLGAGLAQDDSVAGADETREVQLHPAMLTFAFAFPRRRKMLDAKSLDTIFRQARTHNAFSGTVSDAQLHELYDLLKWGPTTMNTQPARFVFVRTKEGKEKLRPALSPGNLDKSMAAPVTVIVAFDLMFYEYLPKNFPFRPDAIKLFRARKRRRATRP
jgi:hypothetical protein